MPVQVVPVVDVFIADAGGAGGRMFRPKNVIISARPYQRKARSMESFSLSFTKIKHKEKARG